MHRKTRKKSPSKQKSKALWGGRFSSQVHKAVERFTQSVHYDRRLYVEDIRGSIAHATMLSKSGIITKRERNLIIQGLEKILKQIARGQFQWKEELEDVHMNIESALTQKTPAGAKLHTGRSRNDQISTDMRLWLKGRTAELEAIRQLQRALVKLAEKNADVLIPGYTHLQRAQPVYFAHHLLAYVEMLERDAGRLEDAIRRADECPLGASAIAGSTLPLNRELTAKLLGFSRVTRNSMDAVSSRDFLIEYNSACAILAVHLSRLSEDLILWSSAEFGFIQIGDAFTTGSSLMPQKRNPDIAELVRGKSGRVIGNLVSLLVLMKGLPMTYNRDLQEDKESVFDTSDTIHASLEVMALMLGDVKVNKAQCESAVSDPLLMATDVVDALVRLKIPFRKAHEIVGRMVALSEQKNIPLNLLPLKEWKRVESKVTADVLKVFDVRAGLDARRMTGAPSRGQIQKQFRFWEKRLSLSRKRK